MALPPTHLVICEYCKTFTTVDAANYFAHIEREHKIFDYEKININKKIIQDEQLILAHIKQQEQYFEYFNSVNSSLPLKDIFDSYRRKGQEEKEKQKQRQERILQKEQEEEKAKQRFIEENTYEYQIIWDDIIFDKDYIKFSSSRIKTILSPVYHKGIFESLNAIKQEYFIRLYSHKFFKLSFLKGEIQREKSTGLSQLLKTIECAGEYYNFRYSYFIGGKIKTFNELSNSEVIKLFETTFNKSNYLKFLAKKLTNDYKIILVKEFINNHVEESFLFRIQANSKQTIIFWENVNKDRATHIFFNSNNTKKPTELVEEFICRNDIHDKRSILHYSNLESEKVKKELKYCCNIRHTTLEQYEIEFENVLLQC